MTGQPGRFRVTDDREPPHADGVTDLGVGRCLDQGGTDLGWVFPTPGQIQFVAFEEGGAGGGGGGAGMGGAGAPSSGLFPRKAPAWCQARCDTTAAPGPLCGGPTLLPLCSAPLIKAWSQVQGDGLALWNGK